MSKIDRYTGHNHSESVQGSFAARLTDRMGSGYGRLAGRGTSALYLALRALALRNGPGEVIVPDLLCSTALDAVLLAGHKPIFADVIPARWTLDPADALRHVTDQTRAVLVAHLFGHIAHMPHEPFRALGIPIVEDAIQGIGGTLDSFADITIIGFADSKLIGGRGGLVVTDSEALAEAIDSLSLCPDHYDLAYTDPRIRAYAPQLLATAPELIRPFNESAENINQIGLEWAQLSDSIEYRNACANAWKVGLSDTPLILADLRPGDAIWRFTLAAPTIGLASLIARQLQLAGIPGTRLYPSLDRWLGGSSDVMRYSTTLAPRLINLLVIPPITPDGDFMRKAIMIIQSACDRWRGQNQTADIASASGIER